MALKEQSAAGTSITSVIDEAKGTLTITLPLANPPYVSKKGEGNNLIIASTGGNLKTGVMVGGKELTIGVNAYTPK